MKKSILFFACFLSFQSAYAKNDPTSLEAKDLEDIEFHEPLERVKIKDIRDLLVGINPDATCMDEYLKRRKQLLVKFTLAPVTLTAAAAAGFVTGGLAGVGIGRITGLGAANDGWAILGYAVGGVMLGTATSIVVITADTAASGINYYDNDLIMKSLGEYYLNLEGEKLEKLYQKVTKKMADKPSKDEFIQKLVELDASGALCDGSLVKQPRIRLGTKLKYKMARPKHLPSVF